MSNWHSKLINKFKKFSLFILLPVLMLILLIRLIDVLRAPELPADFAQQLLHSVDGRDLTPGELSEKKPLLVWFWSTGCSACHDTVPMMMWLNGKRTNVLTVASRSGNDISIVRYLNGHHLTLPVVNDSSGVLATHWQVSSTPTLILVAKGQVVSTTSGWTSSAGIWLRLWWVRKWHY